MVDVGLKLDEVFDAVFSRESWDRPISVFPDSSNEVGCHTDVYDSVGGGGHHVDKEVFPRG